MAVEKVEDTKTMVYYETVAFKVGYLDKEFVSMANKINSGKLSVEKVKSKFQKKMRKHTEDKVSGTLWDEAIDEIYERFAKDYGVGETP